MDLRDLENMLSLSVFNNKNSRFILNDEVGGGILILNPDLFRFG